MGTCGDAHMYAAALSFALEALRLNELVATASESESSIPVVLSEHKSEKGKGTFHKNLINTR